MDKEKKQQQQQQPKKNMTSSLVDDLIFLSDLWMPKEQRETWIKMVKYGMTHSDRSTLLKGIGKAYRLLYFSSSARDINLIRALVKCMSSCHLLMPFAYFFDAVDPRCAFSSTNVNRYMPANN